MAAFIRRVFKYLAYAAAAAVMLLALLVGVARLLLPLVPEYQEDIRALATEATGFDVQFQHISASWPITGPEIQFLDVMIGSPQDREPVFMADRLDVGISLVRLLRDRQIVVSRVGVEATRVEVTRSTDGTFLIQGRPLSDFLPERDPDRPLQLPALGIELRDIEVAYRDLARGAELLDFLIRRLDVQLDDAEVSLDGDIMLPVGFGDRATFSVDLPAGVLFGDPEAEVGEWGVYASGETLNVAHLLEYALDMPTPVASMNGDLVTWVRFAGRVPTGVTAELDFSDLDLRRSPDAIDRYQGIRGRIEWVREGDGWLLAGSGLDLRRSGRFSPRSNFSLAWRPGPDEGMQRWAADAEFVRLHDWFPIVRAIVSEGVRDEMLPSDITGDIKELRLDVMLQPDADPEFDVEFGFEDLGIAGLRGGEGLAGVSGVVSADQAGGRLQLDSADASMSMPKLFAAPLAVERLNGFFVWRVTPDGVHVISDNVRVTSSFAEASSRFEFEYPSNGDSPYLDLTAYAEASSAPPIIDYLPLRRFPEKVSAWLKRSVVAGRVTGADIEVRGPMREFPFDRGEGVLRIGVDVVDGVLDYAPGWPRVDDIEGRLVFDGVGLYTRRNRANYGGISVVDADVRIVNLRKGVLEVSGAQTASFGQVLGFLRASPIADAVGPTLERVSGAGQLRGDVSLLMPFKRLKEYVLQIDVTTEDAQLDLQRLDFGLTGIKGSLTVRNTKFFADELTADLLGEPVSLRLRPAAAGGLYSQFVTVSGRTSVGSWIEVLKLPQADKFSGTTDWQAMLLFPARQEDGAGPPFHILVRSDLNGVESRLPAPLAKPADAVRSLELDVALPSEDDLEVTGRLGSEVTWALRLEGTEDRWQIERGTFHAGSAAALLPLEPGIEVTGRAEFVRFDDWLALTVGEADPGWKELYNSAVLDIDRLSMLGQIFPDVSVDARRVERTWLVAVDGPNLSGMISVPMEPDNENPAVLDVQRLWLLEPDPQEGGRGSDPREVIPVSVSAADFVLGKMRFGSLQADLQSTPSGVMIEPISMQGETFTIAGDAAWLVHPNDDSEQQSRMRLTLTGTDIKAVLSSFGYDPVIEGESVTATADLTWVGAPDENFLFRADGGFSVNMKKGAVLSLEPGGGRLLGVLSVTALPRRLALDFRDVTDEGLGFDILRGDFTVDAGNVYTCNLGLEGSVADMGIVGRTGLDTEDYDQLAVVRPHVSNLFALGGAVVAGPAAGAAVLLFSQIFRKPLSQLGESYYRVTGSWEDPVVEQLQGSEVGVTPLKDCDAYLEDALTQSSTTKLLPTRLPTE